MSHGSHAPAPAAEANIPAPQAVQPVSPAAAAVPALQVKQSVLSRLG
jgi:hypothetical protein